MAWVGEVGLVLDIAGATILSWGLMIGRKQALELGVGRWAFDNDEENLELPAVQDRLAQSRNAKRGLVLLILGFLGQAIGNWPG
jgi:hypothetical protein